MCTINEDHMIYASWDIKCKGRVFFILGYYLSFEPAATQKSKFWKNIKPSGDIIVLHMGTINDDHR